MSDLISREAAIDSISKCMDIYVNNLQTMVYKAEAYKALNEVPSAQPEQKTGHWIDDCTCSVCHWIHEDAKGFALLTNYPFCPNCGADMKGEEDE